MPFLRISNKESCLAFYAKHPQLLYKYITPPYELAADKTMILKKHEFKVFFSNFNLKKMFMMRNLLNDFVYMATYTEVYIELYSPPFCITLYFTRMRKCHEQIKFCFSFRVNDSPIRRQPYIIAMGFIPWHNANRKTTRQAFSA